MKKEFGKQFSMALERTGYTQKTAAKLLNVSPQTIHSYISGKSIPNIETFGVMMKYFGINLFEVFDLTLEEEAFSPSKIHELTSSLDSHQISLIKGILIYFHMVNASKIL